MFIAAILLAALTPFAAAGADDLQGRVLIPEETSLFEYLQALSLELIRFPEGSSLTVRPAGRRAAITHVNCRITTHLSAGSERLGLIWEIDQFSSLGIVLYDQEGTPYQLRRVQIETEMFSVTGSQAVDAFAGIVKFLENAKGACFQLRLLTEPFAFVRREEQTAAGTEIELTLIVDVSEARPLEPPVISGVGGKG